MYIAATKPLFAWDCLPDNRSLETIRQLIKSIPDEKLLESLRKYRGRGRNDYPVHVLWGTLLLTILLRHTSIEACLAELRRNPALGRVTGIERSRPVRHAGS